MPYDDAYSQFLTNHWNQKMQDILLKKIADKINYSPTSKKALTVEEMSYLNDWKFNI